MDEKKIKFLQEIHGGKIRGAQRMIAQKLGVMGSAVTSWFKDDRKPSLDNIIKMSKAFNKSEEEIKEIFSIEEKKDDIIYSNFAIVKDMEVLKEKIKRLEAEFELLKTKLL